MPVEIDAVFHRGGAKLVSFLEFCVLSTRMDPVFLFLVQEYRSQPTCERAIALYELFCAPQAPARLRDYQALPPRNLRIVQLIDQVRPTQPAVISPEPSAAEPGQVSPPGEEPGEWPIDLESSATAAPLPTLTAGRYWFDDIAVHLRRSSLSSVGEVARSYQPQLSPLENLPGGRLTQGQRAFLDGVWRPTVRPRLVAAGFRRIANIGG